MNRIQTLFLQALGAALRQEQVEWTQDMSPEEWQELFRLAREHHLLPMILEAVYRCPAIASADPALLAGVRQSSRMLVTRQAVRTVELLQLFRRLLDAGATPMVVKGLVCRELYPQPDHRVSGDEDILIPPEQYPLCREVLTAFGMVPAGEGEAPEEDYEIPFVNPSGQLYVELHKSLFPPDSDAYGDLNRYFEGANDRAVTMTVMGSEIRTLCPTDHLFYLICHAFKHFLHSGFGIRQVCDIALFANRYGSRIDWAWVLESCRAIRAERFTAGLLAIGGAYLGFDPEAACLSGAWREIRVDPEPLLRDLLLSGVYGGADMTRKHSSNITLHAVAAQKQGRKARGSALVSLFPPAKSLEGRYPYLKDRPWLLPAAWVSRIAHYGREKQSRSNRAADSLRLGNERVALLREYGIID